MWDHTFHITYNCTHMRLDNKTNVHGQMCRQTSQRVLTCMHDGLSCLTSTEKPTREHQKELSVTNQLCMSSCHQFSKRNVYMVDVSQTYSSTDCVYLHFCVMLGKQKKETNKRLVKKNKKTGSVK